jgi:stage V sporulation protein S
VIAEVRSTEETVLRVGSTSDVKQLASSISFATGDSKQVVLRAIGAGAVNQMMKACAIARGYVATRGIDLTIRPGFQEVMVPDIVNPKTLVKRTALIAVVRVS